MALHQYNYKEYSSHIPLENIPESWNSIEEFHDWYVGNGMPFLPPENVEIHCSDDATAVCVFRKGQFQVELYLVHPNPLVQVHEHPGVRLIKIMSKGVGSNGVFGCTEGVLDNGGAHGLGGRSTEENGFLLMGIEQWHPSLTPSTVAAAWKGKTAGPKHEALIRRLRPNALVVDGYADTTKTMDYLEELKGNKNGK